jgi:hypothetical protein
VKVIKILAEGDGIDISLPESFTTNLRTDCGFRDCGMRIEKQEVYAASSNPQSQIRNL